MCFGARMHVCMHCIRDLVPGALSASSTVVDVCCASAVNRIGGIEL